MTLDNRPDSSYILRQLHKAVLEVADDLLQLEQEFRTRAVAPILDIPNRRDKTFLQYAEEVKRIRSKIV